MLLAAVLECRAQSERRPLEAAAAALARNRSAPWPVRRAATLLLEHLLLRSDELSSSLRKLRISGVDAGELRARMSRHARVHESLATDAEIGDFFHLATRDCRLTLARYLFGEQEIIDRIERQLRRSRGIRSRPDYGHRLVEQEAAHILDTLPPLEHNLIAYLGCDATMRFITEQTSDDINMLVEHPVGT